MAAKVAGAGIGAVKLLAEKADSAKDPEAMLIYS